MNEHSPEYIVGKGKNMRKFEGTSPLWTICTTKIVFGNVDVSTLVGCMDRLLPSVKRALGEIFIRQYINPDAKR